MNDRPVIETFALGKRFPGGTRALSDVSLTVSAAEFIAIIGRSGAGKSTLLRCISRLLTPTEGRIELAGADITFVGGASLRQVRQRIGMVFQQFNLVGRLSVLDNVLAGRSRFNQSPLRLLGSLARWFPRCERESALAALEQVGIAELAFRRADTLSGGQQQRVAIARVLAQGPEVVLADEPIASLDPRSAALVMDTLAEIHTQRRLAVIANLHHVDLARKYATRIIGMRAGCIVFDGLPDELSEPIVQQIYDGEPSIVESPPRPHEHRPPFIPLVATAGAC